MWAKVKDFLFRNAGLRQTIAKNTFWLGVSNVGGRVIRAIIIIYAARVLGAGEWGAFSYGIALVAFFTILSDFGVNSVLTREAAKQEENENRVRILTVSFWLKTSLLTTAVLATALLAPYLTSIERARQILPILALVLMMDALRDFGFSIFRAKQRMELEAVMFLLTNVAIVVFGFLFLFWSKSVVAFSYAYAAGAAVGTAATLFLIRDSLRLVRFRFPLQVVKSLLLSAWPFALSSLLGGLMVNTDVVILGWLRPAEDVGFYSAAQRLILLFYIIPGILATSIFPILSNLAKKDDARAGRIVEIALRSALLVALPMSVGGLVLGRQIVNLVFGQEYLPGTVAFQILVLTLAMNFAAVILSNVAFAYDRRRKLVNYALLGGLSNILLDLLLIPRWGIAGSAFATLVVQTISVAYLWRAVKEDLSFRVLPHAAKMASAALLMGVLVYGLIWARLPAASIIILGAVFYFGLLYILREPVLLEIKRLAAGFR